MSWEQQPKSADEAVESASIPMPDAYYEHARNANVRFPFGAGDLAFTLFTAELLAERDFDPQKFAAMDWTSEQLRDAGVVMNRAHLLKGVPVRSREAPDASSAAHVVDGERLRRGFDGIKAEALRQLVAATGGVAVEFPGFQRLGALASQGLADDHTRSRITKMYGVFAACLKSPEGLKATREIAHAYASRSGGKTVDEDVDNVVARMCHMMVDTYRSGGGDLSDEVASALFGRHYSE